MKYILFIISLLVVLCSAPQVIYAASVSMYSDSLTVKQGTEVVVDVTLSVDEPIDVLGGYIHFDPNALTLKEVRDANSLVNFWIEKPNLEKKGDVAFSGMTPSGIIGKDLHIFSVTFIANIDGPLSVDFRDGVVFNHDGTGIQHVLKSAGLSVRSDQSLALSDDREPPEPFVIYVARDPNMFDEQYFIVFATQDKASGVDHYEVREGNFGPFTTVEAPYVLRDQSLRQDLFVKAVDKAGNERLAERSGDQAPYPWYKLLVLGIVIGIIIIIVIVWRTLKK